MLPFSPLRILGTGLLSWALLLSAIYCLWQWQREAEGPAAPAVARVAEPVGAADAPAGELPAVEPPAVAAAQERRDMAHDEERRWGYLAAGLGLLALSCGGFWPVRFFLGRAGRDEPRSERCGEVFVVDRPDGSRLHIEASGNPQGPTLVFTHGWSLDSTAWQYARRELGQHFRIVVWDLPGLGQSRGSARGDYRLEKLADDLGAVLERVGQSPVILVGHSIGGMIMQTYCRLYPRQLKSRVAGLVLVHTTYTNPLRTAWLAPLWTALERPLVIPLNYLTIGLAPLAWLSNWQSYLNGTLHLFTRFASFAGDQTRGQVDYGALLAAKSWPAVVARGNLAMLEFDEQLTLPELESPVLVIGGRHDRMTKYSASERLEAELPQAVLAPVPAGHLGLWERHAEVNALIRQFAEQHAARPSGAAANTPSPLKR